MNEKKRDDKLRSIALSVGGVLVGAAGALLLTRIALGQIFRWATTRIMTDDYDENLAEFYSAGRRMGVQNIMETNLRAEKAQALARPLGSPKKMPAFDDLMFNMAQLHRRVTPTDAKIDLSVTIGPSAKKPLKVLNPILIAPMAYGEALAEGAKVALARGASMAGSAINSGEGPILPSERRAASRYIIQYNRGSWAKDPEVLRQADAIEVQIGQGAITGVGHSIRSEEIDARLRKQMGLQKGQDAIIHARQQHTATPKEFGMFLDSLRELTGGVPMGAKIGAGMDIEQDIEFLVKSGVDFITIDGAQAATKGSAPILQDDFGLPTLFALCRSVRQLEHLKVRGKVTLIVGGGLFTPGHFLKAVALGADAVYIGTAALFAVTHTQTLKSLPYEPPTQSVWYKGKYAQKFNVEEGSKAMGTFLKASAEEMAAGVMALGKTSLKEVNRDDLYGLTPTICELTGVKPAWKAKN